MYFSMQTLHFYRRLKASKSLTTPGISSHEFWWLAIFDPQPKLLTPFHLFYHSVFIFFGDRLKLNLGLHLYHTYPRIIDISLHNGYTWVITDQFHFSLISKSLIKKMLPLCCRRRGKVTHSSWNKIGRLVFELTRLETSHLYSPKFSNCTGYILYTLCWRQSHPLCELKTLVIEDPADGDISVRRNTGEDHRSLWWDFAISGLHEGLFNKLCEEREDTKWQESRELNEPFFGSYLIKPPGGWAWSCDCRQILCFGYATQGLCDPDSYTVSCDSVSL